MKETNKNIIAGRNAVIEAIKSQREIEKILVAKGAEGSIKKIVAMARDNNIQVQTSDKNHLDRLANDIKHQGVLAYVSEYKYSTVDEILEVAKNRKEDPFVIILDNIEDPHNLGAIMRTIECCGAHGVIVGKRRSVGLTDTVAKSSAGAIEYVKCARVTNISNTIEYLREKGLWIGACDMDGDLYTKSNLKGALGIVIGSEGKGIGKRVKEMCDFTVSIPLKGKINSLNASNAGAVLMYEVRRQRDG